MSDEITKNSDEEIIQENTGVNKFLDMILLLFGLFVLFPFNS